MLRGTVTLVVGMTSEGSLAPPAPPLLLLSRPPLSLVGLANADVVCGGKETQEKLNDNVNSSAVV
jgi:hypothetical protein